VGGIAQYRLTTSFDVFRCYVVVVASGWLLLLLLLLLLTPVIDAGLLNLGIVNHAMTLSRRTDSATNVYIAEQELTLLTPPRLR